MGGARARPFVLHRDEDLELHAKGLEKLTAGAPKST